METFFLAFIPLFVAIDVLGVLPLFVSLTENLSAERRGKLTLEATLTAFIISVVFLATGKLLFSRHYGKRLQSRRWDCLARVCCKRSSFFQREKT